MANDIERLDRIICCPDGCQAEHKNNEETRRQETFTVPWTCCAFQERPKTVAILKELREPSEGMIEAICDGDDPCEAFTNGIDHLLEQADD